MNVGIFLSHQHTQSPETQKFDLSSLRVITFGAAPVSPEITKSLYELLPNAEAVEGFGMSLLNVLRP